MAWTVLSGRGTRPEASETRGQVCLVLAISAGLGRTGGGGLSVGIASCTS